MSEEISARTLMSRVNTLQSLHNLFTTALLEFRRKNVERFGSFQKATPPVSRFLPLYV